MAPKLEEISLVVDTRIFERGEPMHYVYFPNSGIISLLAEAGEDSTLIACIVGNEGMSGLPLFLGSTIAPVRAVVQGHGTANRMRATDFLEECAMGGTLPNILLGFVSLIFVQILQSSVCYRYHSIEKRTARWLLMTADRMESNEFRMTQDYLSNMVGVRREAVSAAAGLLQKKKIISYSRGTMIIIDRPALEASACKCYSIIRNMENSPPHFARMQSRVS